VEQASCHQFADPYAEKDALNLTLDLILLKGVLLHLLYNRGTSPRRVDKNGNVYAPDVVKESEIGEKVCLFLSSLDLVFTSLNRRIGDAPYFKWGVCLCYWIVASIQ
jgi:hypothetical protein